MKIYFVRHGETVANANREITGWVDSPLNEDGIEQAKKVSLEIATDFSEIICSDLVRCKQTAGIINEKLNLPIAYDARLRERNLGSWGGRLWSDMDAEMRETDRDQKYDYRSVGGESVEGVKKRVFDVVDEIRLNKKGKKVLVVTHGGIIRLLHNLINKQVHEIIHNSSLHEFEFED